MKFSVVIPTRDREEQLRECLRRVMPQAGECEVIVTDDGTAAQKVVEEFPNARWVQGPRRGPAANRNCGARAAGGEWLIFLDDDCLPESGWLAAYRAAAIDNVDVLEGSTECPLKDEFSFHEVVENLDGGAYWSCNLAIRRARFEELGGFDEEFTEPAAEDMELAWRMRQRGLRRVFVDPARVVHPARGQSLAGLMKRMAMHRWVVLYRIKTGQSRGVAALLAREIVDCLRMTYQLLRERRRPKGRAMAVCARWATLWLFLPYYACWEIRWKRLKK